MREFDPVLRPSQPISVSIDYEHSYRDHKQFFDALAVSLQATGNRVGIITGMREKGVYRENEEDIKAKMLSELGFKPDFVCMWGQNESIGNGGLWKAQRMDDENVLVHFDVDAVAIKRFTGRWVIKTFTNDELKRLGGQPDVTGMA